MGEDFWDKVFQDLGFDDTDMNRARPYNGQFQTLTGIRGATKIEGITFRDLRDAFIRAVCLTGVNMSEVRHDEAEKGEGAHLCEEDIYSYDWNEFDPMAIMQNLSCEIERLMGIHPNLTPRGINETKK